MSATAWAFVAFLSGCAWVALACLWPDLAKIALGAILAAIALKFGRVMLSP